MNKFIHNNIFYNYSLSNKNKIYALINSSYNINEKTCYISKFYISDNLRKKNISKNFFCNHENVILINHPEIKYFRLNAINFNHDNKLVKLYNNFGFKEDLNFIYDINYGEIIPMIKIIK